MPVAGVFRFASSLLSKQAGFREGWGFGPPTPRFFDIRVRRFRHGRRRCELGSYGLVLSSFRLGRKAGCNGGVGSDYPGPVGFLEFMIGRIKTWLPEKGFGFVWTEAGEFFFHQSQTIGEMQRGDEVSFWLDDDPHGRDPRAVEVQRIGGR